MRNLFDEICHDSKSRNIFRICKFSIIRVVLNRSIDGGDSNAILIAVKIQVKFFCKKKLLSFSYVFFRN